MSDNEKKTKPKYKTPTVIDLGGLARGIGACGSGYSPDDSCGHGAIAHTSCGNGTIAVTTCLDGTSGHH